MSLTTFLNRNRCYFQTVHRSFPMIDQAKFLSRAREEQIDSKFLGLRYAMWAHAAALSSAYSGMSECFYENAREHMEHAELKSPSSSTSIVTLQINILLALYELEKAYFMRAWASVGRAIWLSQMLQLHELDAKDVSRRKPAFETFLADTDESDALEERRKTFWAVYTLNCFIGIGVGWNTGSAMDHSEVSTPLLFLSIYFSGLQQHCRNRPVDQMSTADYNPPTCPRR